jgi:hypothetical protein
MSENGAVLPAAPHLSIDELVTMVVGGEVRVTAYIGRRKAVAVITPDRARELSVALTLFANRADVNARASTRADHAAQQKVAETTTRAS